MPTYGESSRKKLGTCHQDLIVIFQNVVEEFDNTILYGMRTPTEQYNLFMKGRERQPDGTIKIVDRSKVVTYLDGMSKKSNHNLNPSMAVDATPYPIDFTDTKRQIYFAGKVMGIAQMLYNTGAISHKLKWGGDWNQNELLRDETFSDLLHFELIP